MTVETATYALADDRRARRNVWVLAVAQALYGSAAIIIFTLGSLTGQMLSVNKALATVPISAYVIGAALATYPASLFMQKVGRRAGFITGAVLGFLGTGMSIAAIWSGSFVMFTAAMLLAGQYQAFAQFYRFAAADTASEDFRPKAISRVLVGGVIAAFAGPQIAIWSKDLLAPLTFAGAFAAAMGLSVIAMLVLSQVNIPKPVAAHYDRKPRPTAQIVLTPHFIVAVICAMTSYAIMNLVMTATPLAMIACGFTVTDAAFVIQWHVVAMYAPGFITGYLIARFGVRRIVAFGLVLLAACGIVALTGVDLNRFWLALVLLGVGWNFAFVGATAMVTECYRPEEKAHVQGLNDFLVFGSVALASLTSGILFQTMGWDSVNLAIFPFVLIALGLIVWLSLWERRQPGEEAGVF